MSLTRPYNYWSEISVFSTSNTEWAPDIPTNYAVPALRANDDTYVRSRWEARVAYYSPATNPTYSWWASSTVRLVICLDPQAIQEPADVGDNNVFTLAWCDMQPRRWPLPSPANAYMIDWVTEPGGVIHQTRRDFIDAGHKPQVLAALFASDANGFLEKVTEPTAQIRYQISGRVLWESTQSM